MFISFIIIYQQTSKHHKELQNWVMKYPVQNNPKKQSPQKLSNHQLDDQHSPILQQYDLNHQQLDSMLKTLKKVKKISKNSLSQYKKKCRKLNRVFGEMSQFFMNEKRQKLLNKKTNKVQRQELRQGNIFKRLRKLQQKNYLRDQKRIQAQKSSLQQSFNPIIIESENNGSQTSNKPININCYICRQSYTQMEMDDLYPKHCPKCAQFSKIKRYQTCQLTGYTALVTGGRIKIGFEIVLKLLRDGCIVYTTTRFSHDAYNRFQKEKDFDQWKNRLFIIQCDFMSAVQVKSLIQTIKQNVKQLDILINNAAQTIVRPKKFFALQIQQQNKAIKENSNILKNSNHIHGFNNQFPSLSAVSQPLALESINNQIEMIDQKIDLQNLDQFGQPIDRRIKNSWVQKIEDTSLMDCLTTQTINSTVPFFLIGQLKPLMGKNKPTFIINVSSMEGVFYRAYKSSNHAHTNMAKAALNMITRTCALSFSHDNIYMNSVDTGWVTNQNPLHVQERMRQNYKFQAPLDCIEGAMRVIDPIYQSIKLKQYKCGKFFKDYKQSYW